MAKPLAKRKTKNTPQKQSGYWRARRALAEFGKKAIYDGRTHFCKELSAKRAEYVADMGGEAACSAKELDFCEQLAWEWTFLKNLEAHIAAQPTPINHAKRQLYGVVSECLRLLDAHLRHLTMVGLSRRAKQVQDARSYVAQLEADEMLDETSPGQNDEEVK